MNSGRGGRVLVWARLAVRIALVVGPCPSGRTSIRVGVAVMEEEARLVDVGGAAEERAFINMSRAFLDFWGRAGPVICRLAGGGSLSL